MPKFRLFLIKGNWSELYTCIRGVSLMTASAYGQYGNGIKAALWIIVVNGHRQLFLQSHVYVVAQFYLWFKTFKTSLILIFYCLRLVLMI